MNDDTANTTNVQHFSWGGIDLAQVVYIDGIPHPTKQAMGEWLEYVEPRKYINKLLDRNPHIDHYSVDVKLGSTDGKNYETKVYHPIGFLLIVMESGQPKALACKVAVAEFVWHFAGPQGVDPKIIMAKEKEYRISIQTFNATTDPALQALLLQRIHRYSRELGYALPQSLLEMQRQLQLEMEV